MEMHSAWDCPIKADEARRQREAEVKMHLIMPEPSDDSDEGAWDIWFHYYQYFNDGFEVLTREIELNKVFNA